MTKVHLTDHDAVHHAVLGGSTTDLTWEKETIELVSVGVDVGSATTHATVSRLSLQRVGQLLSSAYTVVGRESLWRSEIILTPYCEDDVIDSEAVRTFVGEQYRAADLSTEDVDTGAVLLTGTALLRRNSESLARALADISGQFVCATAGHHIEAFLAANGSGAVGISRRTPGLVLHLDIGGGTAKFAWIRDGTVLATAALAIGGRLLSWRPEGTIDRLEEYLSAFAADRGIDLALGNVLSGGTADALANEMAHAVVMAAQDRTAANDVELLRLTEWPEGFGRPDLVTLSGGVAEYLRRDPGDGPDDTIRDLGARLSLALGVVLDRAALDWQVAPHAIRATVLGAAGHSATISGNTVFVSDDAALPVRDVPVVPVALDGDFDQEQIAARVVAAILPEVADAAGACLWLDLSGDWTGYSRVSALAHGLRLGWTHSAAAGRPLIVVMARDLAQSLGRLLTGDSELPVPLICLDGIELARFDYIDIGEARPGNVYPVVIKSLVFPSTTRNDSEGGCQPR